LRRAGYATWRGDPRTVTQVRTEETKDRQLNGRAEPSGRFSRERAAEGLTDLPRRSWLGVLKRSVREFKEDNLTDWAAALT
jgi:hypothetical protein